MAKQKYLRRMTLAIAAVALATPPTAVAKQPTSEPSALEIASRPHQPAPPKGALVRAVGDLFVQGRDKEASPFEPPGKPPGRPPLDPPGHNDPPNPPGKPPDRPPAHH